MMKCIVIHALIFSILTVFGFESQSCAQDTAVPFPHIGELAKELDDELGGPSSLDEILKTRFYKRIRDTENAMLWNYLIEQEDVGLQFAGFCCFREKAPNAQFSAATRMILAAERPMMAHLGLAYEAISKGTHNDRDLNLLQGTLNLSTSNDNIIFIVKAMTDKDLETLLLKAIQNQDFLTANTSHVVMELSARGLLEKHSDNVQFQALMKKMENCPGYPRYAYLVWTDRKDINELLRDVLMDETIEDTMLLGLIIMFRDGKREVLLDITKELLIPKRKALLERMLRK